MGTKNLGGRICEIFDTYRLFKLLGRSGAEGKLPSLISLEAARYLGSKSKRLPRRNARYLE